jgi:hypothetical protein
MTFPTCSSASPYRREIDLENENGQRPPLDFAAVGDFDLIVPPAPVQIGHRRPDRRTSLFGIEGPAPHPQAPFVVFQSGLGASRSRSSSPEEEK